MVETLRTPNGPISTACTFRVQIPPFSHLRASLLYLLEIPFTSPNRELRHQRCEVCTPATDSVFMTTAPLTWKLFCHWEFGLQCRFIGQNIDHSLVSQAFSFLCLLLPSWRWAYCIIHLLTLLRKVNKLCFNFLLKISLWQHLLCCHCFLALISLTVTFLRWLWTA